MILRPELSPVLDGVALASCADDAVEPEPELVLVCAGVELGVEVPGAEALEVVELLEGWVDPDVVVWASATAPTDKLTSVAKVRTRMAGYPGETRPLRSGGLGAQLWLTS
jgi:hypothetical protein